MRALFIAGLLVAIGLAGCADSPPADDSEAPDDFGDEEVQADETTGGIRGVVVNDARRTRSATDPSPSPRKGATTCGT